MAGSNSDTENNDSSISPATSIPTSFTTELERFNFKDEAIDTALRKLLAKVQLPKEAQQIDRAMEDFAKHYHMCNPTLTDSPDPIYAVAFSILLLHTDAHNKNVKRKMNKDTFIMRTKVIEGGETVYTEILDVMYDNIVSSEFTYAHDQQDKSSSWFSKKPSLANTLLHDLHHKLKQMMPEKNTFSYKLTPKSVINIGHIHQSIDNAQSLQLAGVRTRQQQVDANETYVARVCKAGVIERKYDLAQGGKRAPARGWRPFGMILSGSQIMFFGDLATFQSWLERAEDERQIRHLQLQQQPTQHPFSSTLASPTSASSTQSKHPMLQQTACSYTASSNVSTPTTMTSFSTVSSTHSFSASSVSNLPIIGSSTTSLSSPRSSTSTTTITPTSVQLPPSSSSSSSSNTLYLRPVQIVSLLNAICLYDEAYTKYPHVFKLVAGDGQQFLIRGESAEDIDDWVQKINYVSTMKTTGVRLRPKLTSVTTVVDNESGVASNNQLHYRHHLHPHQHHLPGIHYQAQYRYSHHDGYTAQHWAKREAKAKQKVISLSEQLAEEKRQLEKDKQLRDQLMVLTPVQKATKDRMLVFADAIGKRLVNQRIAVQKLECYREHIERELLLYQSVKNRERESMTGDSGDHIGDTRNGHAGSIGGSGRGVRNGKSAISRKLSAPLPFYSGLLQVRSATAPPIQTSANTSLMRSPFLGMTMTQLSTVDGQDNDNSNSDNDTLNRDSVKRKGNKNLKNENGQPDIRIPHRSSSLLISLSTAASDDCSERVDDAHGVHTGVLNDTSADSGNDGSQQKNNNTGSTIPSASIETQRLSFAQRPSVEITTTSCAAATSDHQTSLLTEKEYERMKEEPKPTNLHSNDSTYYPGHPRLTEMKRVSRQRSHSNPVSPVQIIHSYSTNSDRHDDRDEEEEAYIPSSLQVPGMKSNRDRSMSDVTTDDEDFTLLALHSDHDTLVNHADRNIVDVI